MRQAVIVALLTVLALSACSQGPDEAPVWSDRTGTDDPNTSTNTATNGDVPTLVEPECDDAGSCAAGFLVYGRFHSLSCGAVRADLVTDEILARGELYGETVEVRSIEGVSADVLVAVSLEGGRCGDDDVALSPWSMVFPEGASPSETDVAICAVVVEEHKERNDCG